MKLDGRVAQLEPVVGFADLHALGRIIDPAEIASVVAFLASDDASAITGATITVDAGLTAHVNIGGRKPYGA
jgi:NAD(P)-dependent dehydrogenase (short-subunit alcohol dehydrogenase family)